MPLFPILGGLLFIRLMVGNWLEVKRVAKTFLEETVESILGGWFFFGLIYAVQFRSLQAALIGLGPYLLYRLAKRGWPNKGWLVGVVDDFFDGFIMMLSIGLMTGKVELLLRSIGFSFFVG